MLGPAKLLMNLFLPLRDAGPDTHLSISPCELDGFAIILVICIFIIRSFKHFLGFGTAFKPSRSKDAAADIGSTAHGQDFCLPSMSLSMPLKLRTADRNTFAKAIGLQAEDSARFQDDKGLLSLYLAAVSEPAMLLLLAKTGCPVRPLGGVNVRNRFELLEPGLCHTAINEKNSGEPDEVAQKSLSPFKFFVHASFPCPARCVRRGLEVDIRVEIIAHATKGEDVSAARGTSSTQQLEATTIFRQTFTMLQFMKFKRRDPKSPPDWLNDSLQDKNPTTVSSQQRTDRDLLWKGQMSACAPKIWARLCKDYNPIHFSPVLAKILGQSGQLAHGNHAVSICMQALSMLTAHSETKSEKLTADRLGTTNSGETRSPNFSVNIRFRRPIVLPANIGIQVNSDGDGNGDSDDGYGFEIVDCRTGKTCVEIDI